MQIDADETTCPACGAARLTFHPIIHHMICAYVGPEYDFAATPAGLACPKCGRVVSKDDAEIIGTSARCEACHAELVVSPPE